MEAEKKPVTAEGVNIKAILVGCNNYPDPENELKGCHNNAYNMHNILIKRFNFDPKRILVMVDTPGSKHMPTAANIKKQLEKMIEDADEGHRLFFYFSGHGMTFCHHGETKPAIVPCDDNLITYCVSRLHKKATFTIMADSCNSGGLIDQEPVQVGLPYIVPHKETCGGENKPKMIPYESYMANLSSRTGLNDPDIGAHLIQLFGSEASIMFWLPPHQHPELLKSDQGILLSGGEPDELTFEDRRDIRNPCGAFTKTVVAILNGHPAPITNRQLIVNARGILGIKDEYERQHPCLYCSQENANAIFLRKASEIGETSA
ncbi:hypothetical protein ABFS83_11G020200 [Erythranthe nasuta]